MAELTRSATTSEAPAAADGTALPCAGAPSRLHAGRVLVMCTGCARWLYAASAGGAPAMRPAARHDRVRWHCPNWLPRAVVALAFAGAAALARAARSINVAPARRG